MIINFFKKIINYYVDAFKIAKTVDKKIWILLGVKTILVLTVVIYFLPKIIEK